MFRPLARKELFPVHFIRTSRIIYYTSTLASDSVSTVSCLIGGRHETITLATARSGNSVLLRDDDDGHGQRKRSGRAERGRAEQREQPGVGQCADRRYDRQHRTDRGDGDSGRRGLRLHLQVRRERGREPDDGDLRLHRHIRQRHDGDYAGRRKRLLSLQRGA